MHNTTEKSQDTQSVTHCIRKRPRADVCVRWMIDSAGVTDRQTDRQTDG